MPAVRMPAARTWRTAATVLLATLMLVVAADYVAYAATGKSVVLGKTNNAAKTTTLSSKKGPALSLKSKPSAPSLAVSSSKLVKNLNADALEGKNATQLSPRTLVMEVGEDQDEAEEETFFLTDDPIPAGSYLATLDGFVVNTGDPGFMQCLMASENLIETIYEPVEDPDDVPYDELYLLGAIDTSVGLPVLSESSVVTLAEPTRVGYGCISTESFYLADAPTFTLRKLNGTTAVDSDDYELPEPPVRPGQGLLP